jgi:hypothetical protein
MLAPVSAATVSSLMMGFAWGTGGLSVPLVGMIADRVGIEHTLVGLALVPLAAAALALPLPERAKPRRSPRVPRTSSCPTPAPEPARTAVVRYFLYRHQQCRATRSHPTGVSYSFGPGPITPAREVAAHREHRRVRDPAGLPPIITYLGLSPQLVLESGWIWQPVTYLFLHTATSSTSCSTCWGSGCSASRSSGCGAPSSS